MNQQSTSPFVRKIIYIALMGGLLIPLSFIGRPEFTDKDKNVTRGRLAQMRHDQKLSQASISEIDPTSEAMKLASMGLRGVAVNVLWMQALEHQKNEDYDKLAQTLQTLTKLQPNFIKVWEYQGHNLAFNVSMEFDDYEYRYEWVKKGLTFLKGGIAYNTDDHRMTDNLGFFTGTKFGKSDERLPFRRIFRKDKEFHNKMDDKIRADSYVAREYGPDSYMMAWQWYNLSEELVANGSQKFKSDMMFHMNRPSQRRQQAMILADEFRTDEVIREIWEDAGAQWDKYGNLELRNSQNVVFKLEDTKAYDGEVAELRSKLDKLVPGVREPRERQVWTGLGFDADLFYLTQEAPELLDDRQKRQRASFFREINNAKKLFDLGVADVADEENVLAAQRLADEIGSLLFKRNAISRDGGVINYTFWKSRTTAEATDGMVRARQAIFDAEEMKRKSIFEDEYVFNYATGEKTITRSGAAKLYEEAFALWDEVLKEHEEIIDSPVFDDLVKSMKDYERMLDFSGKSWPDDFVLQWVIDDRAADGNRDELPTSDDIEDLRDEDTDEDTDEDDDKDDVESDESKPSQLVEPSKSSKPSKPREFDAAGASDPAAIETSELETSE